MNPISANKLSSLALRPAAPPDEPFLLRLYGTTRNEELDRSGWPAEQREAFIRSQYLARRADYATRFPDAEHSILTVNNREAGTWMVGRLPTEIRLINIELLPEYRGHGIGGTLLKRLIKEGKTTGLPLRLSVREDNPRARDLYRKLGLSVERREGGYLFMRRIP